MKTDKIIPIFYACDDAFIKYTIVSLTSMIENASKKFKYRVHILCTDVCPKMKEKTLRLANENFEIRFEDVSAHLHVIQERLPIRDYYSKTTYYRLFIATMFPEYDKAIYIDSDTIVLGDISELYDHDIGDNYVGAANEQVMIQNDTFGTYVETVVGISRYQFFNAGILLINCDKFREDKVLDQFIGLLKAYTFVVTQDEDYLNVICKNKVYWLDQAWNTEVFGTIDYSEKKFKIIHYIMTSKPWHYKDCRYSNHFWKYAEKTEVYDEIIKVLNSYTDQQRTEDRISCERLEQTAFNETQSKCFDEEEMLLMLDDLKIA